MNIALMNTGLRLFDGVEQPDRSIIENCGKEIASQAAFGRNPVMVVGGGQFLHDFICVGIEHDDFMICECDDKPFARFELVSHETRQFMFKSLFIVEDADDIAIA